MRITIRLNRELAKHIADIARTTGKTKSEVVRELIVNGNINISHSKADLTRLSYELNRIGNNLNQIAKLCNVRRAVDIAVLQELTIIEEQLQELLEKCK